MAHGQYANYYSLQLYLLFLSNSSNFYTVQDREDSLSHDEQFDDSKYVATIAEIEASEMATVPSTNKLQIKVNDRYP